MTSERAEQGATPDKHQHQPGATLAAQRESMGWTVEQAAEQLKLAVRQVVAIEKGDYAALPSPAVTRGFVRAYAKILRLDPAPLVAMVPMEDPLPLETGSPVRRDRQTSFSHSRYPTHGKRSNLPLAWIAGVAVVAAAGAAVWHFGLVSLPGSDASGSGAATGPGNGDAVLAAPVEAPGANAPMPDTVLNPSVPLISVPGPATTGNAAPTSPAGAGTTANPPASGATPAAGAPAALAAPAATTPAAATPAAGANTLVLNVREDSWIEVRPQGGKALVSRLVKAGSTETVEVPGGATLTVGNPGGVSATLRGAAVALPPMPGKTVSRVTLK